LLIGPNADMRLNPKITTAAKSNVSRIP